MKIFATAGNTQGRVESEATKQSKNFRKIHYGSVAANDYDDLGILYDEVPNLDTNVTASHLLFHK